MAKKKKRLMTRQRLVNAIPFKSRQLIALTGLLAAIAVVVVAVSQASIPVYRDHWEFWGPRIKSCESGNYSEHHRGPPGATGAWQIQDPTWDHWGGYSRAYLAPPAVQDAKAYDLFLRRGTQPWDASYNCWRSGRAVPIVSSVPTTPAPPPDQPPVGVVEKADCVISGWVYDPTAPANTVSVEIKIDGKSAGVVVANNPRPDVNSVRGVPGNHGFAWTLAGQWRDHLSHSYQVLALDTTQVGVEQQLRQGQLTCEPEGIGDGSGLTGSYFANRNLQGSPALVRLDPVINFNWAAGSPDPKLPKDGFSVRWTGRLLAQYSENYTFKVHADDGVRLYIGDKLVVNHWSDHSAADYTGTIQLETGQSYDLRVEYFEDKGNAVMQLFWSSYSTPVQTIPARQLYPD